MEVGLNGLIKAGVKFILDKVNWKDNKESNTGDSSAATNAGNYSTAEVKGKNSIAIVTGYKSMARGALGCWLVLTERNELGGILDMKAVEIDGKKIKADTWYSLIDGEIKEMEE